MKLPAKGAPLPGNCLSGYILQAGGGLIGKPLGHPGPHERKQEGPQGLEHRDKHLSIELAPKESQPSPFELICTVSQRQERF